MLNAKCPNRVERLRQPYLSPEPKTTHNPTAELNSTLAAHMLCREPQPSPRIMDRTGASDRVKAFMPASVLSRCFFVSHGSPHLDLRSPVSLATSVLLDVVPPLHNSKIYHRVLVWSPTSESKMARRRNSSRWRAKMMIGWTVSS